MTDKPGVYEGLPFDDYLAIDAVSNTRLGQLARSPQHYYCNVGLDEQAKHLVLGSIVHAGQLEPLALAERYAVMPQYELDPQNETKSGLRSKSKSTDWYKEQVEKFEAANRGKTIVPAAWYRQMVETVGQLHICEQAARLLSGPGRVELTLIWDDPDTGIRCKARMDRIAPAWNAFIDLKTTADLEAFPRSLARYGYHRQMAHYQAGWIVLTGEVLTPWIVAVESASPHCVQAAPLDDDSLEVGKYQRRALLADLLKCRADDHWPGPESPTAWRIPDWAMDDGEDIELLIDGKAVVV